MNYPRSKRPSYFLMSAIHHVYGMAGLEFKWLASQMMAA